MAQVGRLTGRLLAALDALAQSVWPRPGVIPLQAARFTYHETPDEGEPDETPDLPARHPDRPACAGGGDGGSKLVVTTHVGGARAGDTAGRPDTEVTRDEAQSNA